MSERRVYELRVRVKSPFLFQGAVNSRLGYDAAALRDEEGRAIVPGTQIKGVFRAAMEAMASAGYGGIDIVALFGARSETSDSDVDAPNRGAALFGDLTATGELDATATTRIALDLETGAVSRGALQVVELAAPSGAIVDFAGTLVIRYPVGLAPSGVEDAIGKALKLIPSIGAIKSAGFGEVVPDGCSITERVQERQVLVPQNPQPNAEDRLAFHVTFDRPIMVDAWRADHNIYKGSTIVPGAAFKGAVAERLRIGGANPSSGVLEKALSAMRFSHAFPIVEGERANLPLPLSLICDEAGETFADIASWQLGEAPLFGGRPAEFVASAKDGIRKKARDRLKLPSWRTQTLERTHVTIDSDSLAASEGQLYSAELTATKGTVWLLEVDCGAVEDRKEAARIISAIGNRIDGIGRTAATAILETAANRRLPEVEGDEATLCLVTPAVMFDGAIEGVPMHERYAGYFRDLLDGAVLENFLAARKLAGGYLASRYRPYGQTYYPFVLTQPGSVFMVKLPTQKSRVAVARALRFGLPAPRIAGREMDWRICPFVPENGFGEVTTRLHGIVPAHLGGLQSTRVAHVC